MSFRDTSFRVRMTAKERAELERAAAKEGRSAADFTRTIIKDRSAEQKALAASTLARLERDLPADDGESEVKAARAELRKASARVAGKAILKAAQAKISSQSVNQETEFHMSSSQQDRDFIRNKLWGAETDKERKAWADVLAIYDREMSEKSKMSASSPIAGLSSADANHIKRSMNVDRYQSADASVDSQAATLRGGKPGR